LWGGQLQFPFGSGSIIVDNTVNGNTIQNDSNTANGVTIIGNHVLGACPATGFAGISVVGATSTVQGNYISVWCQAALRIYGGNGHNVSGNQFIALGATSTTDGIYDDSTGGGSLNTNQNLLQNNSISGFPVCVGVTFDGNTITNNTYSNCAVGTEFSDSSGSGYVMKDNYVAFNQMIGVTTPFVPNNQTDPSNEYIGTYFGNTGFGTSTPSSPLTVYGSTSTPLVLFDQLSTGDILDAQQSGITIVGFDSQGAYATSGAALSLQKATGNSFYSLNMYASSTGNLYQFNSESGNSNGYNVDFETQGKSLLYMDMTNSRVGVSTSTPGSLLSLGVSGNASGINFSLSTSTFENAGGINLTKGCFAINGTCLISSSASSTLLSDNNTFSGVDTFTNGSSNFAGTWQSFSPSHFLTTSPTLLQVLTQGNNASGLNINDAGTSTFSYLSATSTNGASAPAITVGGSTNTGIFSAGTNLLGLASAGSSLVWNGTTGAFYPGSSGTKNLGQTTNLWNDLFVNNDDSFDRHGRLYDRSI